MDDVAHLIPLIEQRRDAHREHYFDEHGFAAECEVCAEPWPCPDRIAAEAALACIAELQAHLEAILNRNHGHNYDPSMTGDWEDAQAALVLIAPPTGKETDS